MSGTANMSLWPNGKAAVCKDAHTGSIPVGDSNHTGRHRGTCVQTATVSPTFASSGKSLDGTKLTVPVLSPSDRALAAAYSSWWPTSRWVSYGACDWTTEYNLFCAMRVDKHRIAGSCVQGAHAPIAQ